MEIKSQNMLKAYIKCRSDFPVVIENLKAGWK